MTEVIADEHSRSNYWFVGLGNERVYPFPTLEAAELFAANNNGKVIVKEEE